MSRKSLHINAVSSQIIADCIGILSFICPGVGDVTKASPFVFVHQYPWKQITLQSNYSVCSDILDKCAASTLRRTELNSCFANLIRERKYFAFVTKLCYGQQKEIRLLALIGHNPYKFSTPWEWRQTVPPKREKHPILKGLITQQTIICLTPLWKPSNFKTALV